MKILIISPPICPPTTSPYSLPMMQGALQSSLNEEISSLDLNALWHKSLFPMFYERLNTREYFGLLTEFMNEARHMYPKVSRAVLDGKTPLGFETAFNAILEKKPDVVGLSLMYNSQLFFSKPLIHYLLEEGIKVIVGGSVDYSRILKGAIPLADAQSFISYLINNGARESKKTVIPKFFGKDVFTKDSVYPLRTSRSCTYKQCTFCIHHGHALYSEIDLENVKKIIKKNNMKKIFLIDDDITVPRLYAITRMLEPLGVMWWCQLRPHKGLIPVLPLMQKAGCKSIAWGVESGCQRTLDRIKKGTILNDISLVLKKSKECKMINMVYVMFGIPGETEEEFRETVIFLENHAQAIDLVSSSVFGLQEGSTMFDHPVNYGIVALHREKRTVLGDKITYEVKMGLSREKAIALKKKYKARLNALNTIPKIILGCKEQVLNL